MTSLPSNIPSPFTSTVTSVPSVFALINKAVYWNSPSRFSPNGTTKEVPKRLVSKTLVLADCTVKAFVSPDISESAISDEVMILSRPSYARGLFVLVE